MTRLATALLAAAALAIAGCGGNGSSPVEGTTTPAAVATSPARTQPAKVDVPAEIAKLRPCVGGRSGTTYKWFQPTVDYAKSLGGDGFTVMLEGQPVTLIAFPNAQAAQYGLKDISDRLIALQQKRPTDYAQVAATASQLLGATVVEVSTAGATSATVNSTLAGCVARATTKGP